MSRLAPIWVAFLCTHTCTHTCSWRHLDVTAKELPPPHSGYVAFSTSQQDDLLLLLLLLLCVITIVGLRLFPWEKGVAYVACLRGVCGAEVIVHKARTSLGQSIGSCTGDRRASSIADKLLNSTLDLCVCVCRVGHMAYGMLFAYCYYHNTVKGVMGYLPIVERTWL